MSADLDENYDDEDGEDIYSEPGFGDPEGLGEDEPNKKKARAIPDDESDNTFQPGGGPAYK